MLKLSWKGVLAHKGRLALTALAIVLGVAFVSGAYVFTDSLKAAFDTLFRQELEVDLVVRAETEFDFALEVGSIPETLLDDVEGVAGVASAVPFVQGYAQLIGPDGEPIGGNGPPTFGFSWVEGAEEVSPLELRFGRPPSGPGEIVVDAFSAEANGFSVGDRVQVIVVNGTDTFEIVGVVGFGDADNLLGATITAFDLETAQEVLGFPDAVTQISIVVDEEADRDTVAAAIEAILPEGAEVITGETEIAEGQEQVDEGVGFFNNVLLAFALTAVFVGGFIILNTFRIIVGQRTRELAMLRAVGATGGQVTRMVVVESLIVGLAASLLGIATGIGLAVTLEALFGALGFGFPDGPLTVRARTIVVAMLVGVGFTVVFAALPAFKASRVPPVAAMRDVAGSGPKSLRGRIIGGLVVLTVGAVLLLVGLFGGSSNALALTGAGAAITFIGVSIVAPLFARAFTRLVGRDRSWGIMEVSYGLMIPALGAAVVAGVLFWAGPVGPIAAALVFVAGAAFNLREAWRDRATFRAVGRITRENAMRQPRRMASTASALTIGVALVSLIAILAASAKAGITEAIGNEVLADFQVEASGFGDPTQTGTSPDLLADLRELPEVGAASTFRLSLWRDPETLDEDFLIGVDEFLDRMVRLEMQGGSFDALGDRTVLLFSDFAEDRGLSPGDPFRMEFPTGQVEDFEVAGIYGAELFGTDVMISMSTFEEFYTTRLGRMIMIEVAAGLEPVEARPAIEAVVDRYPNVQLNDQEEYVERIGGQVDAILNVITGLLAMAIVIALLGITNTMALSIMERKREIGLLRAVGMTRRQVRRMIRWEALLIAGFGAVIGVVVGIGFGVAVVEAIGSGLVLRIPVTSLVVYVVAAAVGGVVASILPGRRGASMNVLDAIAYE
ncbi:MAG: FtsX-like permease family protein [Acidimicrobiia bacterium]|nr:FtsX-like permease family protein [Acidimicrobiia bacterium]